MNSDKIEIKATGKVKDIETYEIKIFRDFSDYLIEDDDWLSEK